LERGAGIGRGVLREVLNHRYFPLMPLRLLSWMAVATHPCPGLKPQNPKHDKSAAKLRNTLENARSTAGATKQILRRFHPEMRA
jgi:hypothetical protein